MGATERSSAGWLRCLLNGRRWIVALVFLAVVVAVGCGDSEIVREPTVAASPDCIRDPKGEVTCGPLPTLACNYDTRTGWPLPGSDPHCPPVLPCDGCTLGPTAPPPTIDFGPFKPNAAAVLPSPPQHRIGDAKALRRADCPEGWLALASDATGMSFCFPPGSTLSGPHPESGGWGWQNPAGYGWDEAATVVVPEGAVAVHRIGLLGGLRDGTQSPSPSEVSGFGAQRYDLRRDDGTPYDPTMLAQEISVYVADRPDGVWEVVAKVGTEPDGTSPSAVDIAAARVSLAAVVETVRIP